MSYALYRKYRPQTFDDVVGQSFITKTLKNQVAQGSFSHAYLFTGTRGTGKTSCARILARAINCPNLRNGEPCNECDICEGSIDGSLSDVTEIDAASNSGVENIRQMRDEIAYLPVSAKYKVYIIDEVHMLSGAAFNALLKTLEEPPEHAIFILATTEVYKVPATVLSRCQRFDFGRIPVSVIADRLESIVRAEGGVLDRESIELVAELGDGSMRDSLSILEKVIGMTAKEEIQSVLGVIDRGAVYDLMEAAGEGRFDKLYEGLEKLYALSKEPSRLCVDMLGEFRNVLLCRSTKEYRRFAERSERDYARIEALAKQYTQSHILYAMDSLQSLLTSLSRSTNKRADVEVCLLRIAEPRFSNDVQALQARVEKLEAMLKNGVPAQTVVRSEPIKEDKKEEKQTLSPIKEENKAEIKQSEPISEEIKPEPACEKKPEPKTETPAVRLSIEGEGKPGEYKELLSWRAVCAEVRSRDMMLGLVLSNETSCVYKDNEFLILCSEEQDRKELADPAALQTIRAAFAVASPVKGDYSLRIAVGNKGMYITDTSLYDNVSDNEDFTFDDH